LESEGIREVVDDMEADDMEADEIIRTMRDDWLWG
jgi:hypothetical protein